MNQVVLFGVFGLAVGSLYALTAQGLVLIYRGSGVLNFGHSALSIFAAYSFWELRYQHGVQYLLAFVAAVAATALLGALIHLVIMRSLRGASALVRVVATLAILICFQAIAFVRYGASVSAIPSALPDPVLNLWGDLTITADRLILIGIATAITAVLYLVYRYTSFGLATSAVAENQIAAASAGLSPDLIAAANWAIGAALAAVAAILIIPISALSVEALVGLLLASLATALVGGFSSFPLTLLGGLLIGVTQLELTRFTTQTGLAASTPFLIIVLFLVVRGRALPLRDFLFERLPMVGTGRVSWPTLAAGIALVVTLAQTLSPDWTDAMTSTFTIAIVLLSIVVITGYTGQISLAQWAFAGLGAFVAGRLVATQGWPFELAIVAGVVVAALVGVVFGLPALRTRGVNLAVITLGLGNAVYLMIFSNANYTGGFSGTVVGPQTFFGLRIDAIAYSDRYALLVFFAFVLLALGVANLRRGRVGRRLLSVRTNERAAAALGIDVVGAKLYAFSLAAGIAAVGGILVAFRSHTIVYESFTNSYSITLVGFAVIGGIGWLLGPFFGAMFSSGALAAHIGSKLWGGFETYVELVAGVILIGIVMSNPDGVAREVHRKEGGATGGLIGDILHPSRTIGRQGEFYKRQVLRAIPPLRAIFDRPVPTAAERIGVAQAAHTVRPPRLGGQRLKVHDLTVRYGAVTAVDGVSLTVEPGKIIGLIGPNGAGKTTLIDAVTGFTPLSGGQILFDGVDIAGWSPARRARAGISRSFQGLELFEDSTVLDNLRAAADPRDLRSYFLDFVYPVAPKLSDHVLGLIRTFELVDDLEKAASDLPQGKRRLLAIARALAVDPSVILLDEPAAGLSEVETKELADVVSRIAREWGLGVLLIEHDVNFVMSTCDEVVVLDFGQTISMGDPAHVRADRAVIAAYLGTVEDAPADHAGVS